MVILKKNLLNYILLIGLLLISGNPFIFSHPHMSEKSIILIIFTLIITIFFVKGLKVDKKFMTFIFLLSLLTIIQSFLFDFFSITTTLGLYIKIITVYITIKILKENFVYSYIKVMYYIVILSFVFYFIGLVDHNILVNLSTDVTYKGVGANRYSFFGLYTYYPRFFDRNCGPFWESGLFAGYILLAFIFTFLSTIKRKNIYLIVFTLGIISTFSTTAYIVYFLFLSVAYFINLKNYFFKIIISLFIIVLGYFSFYYFDFLGKKIMYQYEYALTYGVEDGNTQRFLSIFRDLEDIKGHEVFGRGWNNLTRFDNNFDKQMRTVGLSDIVVKVGGLFFIYMIYLMYNSICKYISYSTNKNHGYCIAYISSILLLLASETYFNMPLFWGLLFLSSIY